MLGVRRWSGEALKLQEDGLIRYARGRITVLDQLNLEQRACRCYPSVRGMP